MILSRSIIEAERLIDEAAVPNSEFAVNPVTGGLWVPKLDRRSAQVMSAARALQARADHAADLPPECKTLPLSKGEREALKGPGAVEYLVSTFARSLACCDYDERHPRFPDYAAAACLSPYAPPHVRTAGLQRRYFARLPVTIGPGLYSAVHGNNMTSLHVVIGDRDTSR